MNYYAEAKRQLIDTKEWSGDENYWATLAIKLVAAIVYAVLAVAHAVETRK